MEKIKVVRIEGEKRFQREDYLSREVPFTLYLNGSEFVTLLASPSALRELTAGFIFSSGLIRFREDIEKIILDEEKWTAHLELKDKEILSELVFKRMYTSGCGKGTLIYNALDQLHKHKNNSSLKIKKENIFSLMADFDRGSQGFKKTGCIHGAALADGKKIILFHEDIGRHNAVDKVIGAALLGGVSFKDKIMLTSGRISSEIIFKVKKSGIPLIASRSAPTNQGTKLAREMNLTLLGFIRGEKMNVYSGEERIL